MPRKYLIVLFLAFAPPLAGQGLAFADSYTQDGKPCPPECVSDSMEIVTWYPSPYNEYEELRLYPTQRDDNYCDNDKIGLMYYDDGGTPSFGDDDKMRVCKGTLLGWQEVGLAYWGASGNNIYNTNSGRVGIGTRDPGEAMLHVKSAPQTHATVIIESPVGGTPYLWLTDGNSGTSHALQNYLGDLQFRRCTSAGCTGVAGQDDTWMTIKSSGNVGIRTTEPKSEIQIGPEPNPGNPNMGSLNMFANRGGRTYGHNIYFNLADLTYRRVTGSFYPTWIEMDSDNRGDIIFQSVGPGAADSIISGAELSGAPKMTIKNNGNVGIGTISPTQKLEVCGIIKASNAYGQAGEAAYTYTSNSGYAFIGPDSGSSVDGAFITLAGPNTLTGTPGGIRLGTVGAPPAMVITPTSGNVGIGTTNPGYKLTVNGSAYCTTGAWSGSDLRWKKNIVTLPDPLERISRLRGVEFDWKQEEYKDKNFPEGRQIGIIAQELEKEFPELVSTDNAGYKSIAYDKLTAVLVEAVKKQEEKIRKQENLMQALEKELKDQKVEIENLKTNLKQ